MEGVPKRHDPYHPTGTPACDSHGYSPYVACASAAFDGARNRPGHDARRRRRRHGALTHGCGGIRYGSKFSDTAVLSFGKVHDHFPVRAARQESCRPHLARHAVVAHIHSSAAPVVDACRPPPGHMTPGAAPQRFIRCLSYPHGTKPDCLLPYLDAACMAFCSHTLSGSGTGFLLQTRGISGNVPGARRAGLRGPTIHSGPNPKDELAFSRAFE